MTAASLFASLALTSATLSVSGAAAVAVTSDQLTSGQQWTVLGILGLVVVVGGNRMLAAMDRQANAISSSAAAQTEASNRVASELRSLSERMQRLPADIANELKDRED